MNVYYEPPTVQIEMVEVSARETSQGSGAGFFTLEMPTGAGTSLWRRADLEAGIQELREAALLAQKILRALPIDEEMERYVDQRLTELEKKQNITRRVYKKVER